MIENIKKWINSGKGIKKENKQFIVFIIGCIFVGGVFGGVGGLISNIKPINTIDVCKCLDLSYKKDSGLSYDESYWNKCVDKYYSKDEMVQKCMFKD